MAGVTNKDILAAVQAQGLSIAAIEQHLVTLNESVAKNTKFREDCTPRLAVLENTQQRHGINWGLVTNFVLAIIQMVVLASMAGK